MFQYTRPALVLASYSLFMIITAPARY